MDEQASSLAAGPRGKTAFSAPLDVRYVGPLMGRYSFAAKDENGDSRTAVYACRTAGLSPSLVSLIAPVPVPVDDRANLLLDHIGLIQGYVTRDIGTGFELSIECTNHERETLAAKINWLKRYRLHKADEKRQSGRFLPRRPDAKIALPDGTSARCLLIDVSTSGAAISSHISPKIGEKVLIGSISGRVIRTMDVGFAIKFDAVCPSDEVETRLHT